MKNKVLFITIFVGFLIGVFFVKQTYAYDGCGCAVDGSYYCYNCDNCSNCCYASCHFCSSNYNACCWYVVWEEDSSKCDDDPPCSSNCDACAGYSYLQSGATSFGTKDVSCTAQCGNTDWDTCYCTSDCTPDSCPSGTSESGTHGLYQTYTCDNQCGEPTSRSCYCTSSCSVDSCPAQYSTSPQGYGNLTYDACTNNCGESQTRTCYCSQCEPDQCDEGTTSEQTGAGDLADTKSCSNDCGVNNSRNCYYECEEASCSMLDSSVEWTDTDCTDQENCRSVEKEVVITDPNPGCSTGNTKTCYINNYRPESPDVNKPQNGLTTSVSTNAVSGVNIYQLNASLLDKFVRAVRAQATTSSVLGYESTTHTGTQLNNPLQVTTEYSDQDGAEDIQALAVWWSPSTEGITFPNRVADPAENLSGRTENSESFGFMISKDESGNWTNLYKPHIEDETTAWVKVDSTEEIVVLGPNELPMVNVSSLSVSSDGENTLTLDYSILFMWEGTFEKVSSAQYHILGLANDTVGFLPFDDSDDIEDSESEYWKDSGITWNVDLQRPVINTPLLSANVSEHELSITFEVEDYNHENDLARVRLDACRNGDVSNNLLVEGRQYLLESCNDVDWGTQNPSDIDMEKGNDLLSEDVTDPQDPVFGIDGEENSVIVDLNGNLDGTITFYLTFMDEAGNWYQDNYIQRLGEWVAVKDALVYSSLGSNSASRRLNTDNGDIWDNDILLKDYGFEEENIDLTNQALLGTNTTTTRLNFLERYEENDSFKAAGFSGVALASPYTELFNIFKERMNLTTTTLNYQEIPLNNGEISGDILSACDDDVEFCIVNNMGDLTISGTPQCDGNGFIVSSGNITIDPDFTNANDSSACIIVAGNNITIGSGEDKSNAGVGVNYDIIEAFLVADGEIIIPSDDVHNGLLIEGGLAAFTTVSSESSVYNLRSLGLDYRNTLPVIAVVGNPKYGLLSKKLFGSQVDILRLDVGFKPY